MPRPMDILAQLQWMDLMRFERPEDILVEPRYITGNGPQGDNLARGRGNLTEDNILFLNFIVYTERRRGYR